MFPKDRYLSWPSYQWLSTCHVTISISPCTVILQVNDHRFPLQPMTLHNKSIRNIYGHRSFPYDVVLQAIYFFCKKKQLQRSCLTKLLLWLVSSLMTLTVRLSNTKVTRRVNKMAFTSMPYMFRLAYYTHPFVVRDNNTRYFHHSSH